MRELQGTRGRSPAVCQGNHKYCHGISAARERELLNVVYEETTGVAEIYLCGLDTVYRFWTSELLVFL